MGKIYILIARDHLKVALGESAPPLLFPFPTSTVQNLELIDQIGFEKALTQFCEQKGISHAHCTLLLDESFLFWKKMEGNVPPDDAFFNMVPLPPDHQGQKQVKIDEKTTILAVYNSSMLMSIERALFAKGNKIAGILPFFAFPAFEKGKIDLLHIDESTVRKQARFDTDILSLNSSTHHMPLIPLIILLVLIMLGGAGIVLLPRYNKLMNPAQPSPQQKKVLPTPTISYLNAADVRIEIQNGSGKAGEAAKLKAVLEAAHLTVSTIGNAENEIKSTRIATKISVPPEVIAALSKKLQEQYVVDSQSIPLKEGSSSADILITIGQERAQ